MNCNYRIIKSKRKIDGLKYTVYGIACCCNGETVAEFKDISFNINEIESLCEYLNINDVKAVHFNDIIEDFLAK